MIFSKFLQDKNCRTFCRLRTYNLIILNEFFRIIVGVIEPKLRKILAASALDQSYRLCTNTKQDRSQPIPNLKDFCEQLIDKTHLAEECVNRLVLGLTRARQPGILNPIRRNIRGQKDDEVKSPEGMAF